MTAESVVSTEPLWLTRERNGGVISSEVEVWLVQPESIVFPDGDVLWVAPTHLVDQRRTLAATLSLGEARMLAGDKVPTDARRPVALARAVARG